MHFARLLHRTDRLRGVVSVPVSEERARAVVRRPVQSRIDLRQSRRERARALRLLGGRLAHDSAPRATLSTRFSTRFS